MTGISGRRREERWMGVCCLGVGLGKKSDGGVTAQREGRFEGVGRPGWLLLAV